MPQKNDHFYAEETQEIMGTIPSWIVRRGIIVIFFIFISLFIGSYFIKYPRTITGAISIETLNAPAEVVAKYTGTIQTLLVDNGAHVVEDQLIAVFSTPADYKDILAIERFLQRESDTVFKQAIKKDFFFQRYSLGELQPYWAEFMKELRAYKDYIEIDYIGKKKMLLEERTSKNSQYYLKQKQQEKLLKQDLLYEQKNVKRDSLLWVREAISQAEYEASIRAYLNKKSENTGFEATLVSTELSILQMRQEITELSMQQHNEEEEYERKLEQLRKQLLSQIEQWKNQYILSAPISGRLSLAGYRKGQYLSLGEVFATIVPQDGMKIMGKMNVSSSGFGEVKKGQAVHIKLNGFPYMEFGMLKGEVVSISATPKRSEQGLQYFVEIAFPNGLNTTYHKKMPLIQQMDGTGEIITKDMRLIEQFIQPIQSLFKNK